MIPRLVATAWFTVVLMLASACSASGTGGPTPSVAPTGTPAPSATAIDTCRLITAQEAFEAMHAPAPVSSEADGRYCYVHVASLRLDLFSYSYDTTAGAAAFAAQRSGSGAQEVPGLGDGAVWLPAGVLAIVKGDREVQITISSHSSADATTRLEEAKAIGAFIVGRM